MVTTPKATSIKKRLYFQPTNLARIKIHLVCLYVRNIPDRICETASKFEKEILKIDRRIVHVLSNMQNVAISLCCFVTFCKQRQRIEQRIIMQAYSAIVLVSVAVRVCLIKLPKTESTAKQWTVQSTRTKQTKAEPNKKKGLRAHIQ